MNGVHYLAIEGVAPSPQKLFKVTIQMDLGKSTSEFTRTFASRNFH